MWQYVTSPDGLRATIVDDQGYTIADLSVPANTTAAQAFPETLRTIVNAPRMLEALRAIEQGATYRLTKGPDAGDTETLRLARDAIARAIPAFELVHLSDDGHGWVGAPYALIDRLGIRSEISRYSYRGPDCAWLEEDCDAGVLMRAMAVAGMDYRIKEERVHGNAWVRDMPTFRK